MKLNQVKFFAGKKILTMMRAHFGSTDTDLDVQGFDLIAKASLVNMM